MPARLIPRPGAPARPFAWRSALSSSASNRKPPETSRAMKTRGPRESAGRAGISKIVVVNDSKEMLVPALRADGRLELSSAITLAMD